MLKGINYITIAVSDLATAIDFYQGVLGMQLQVKWRAGAYLTVAGQWICLSVDPIKFD